jgi:hypothetical protein
MALIRAFNLRRLAKSIFHSPWFMENSPTICLSGQLYPVKWDHLMGCCSSLMVKISAGRPKLQKSDAAHARKAASVCC